MAIESKNIGTFISACRAVNAELLAVNVQILRKYPSPPHGWSLEIPRWGGGGVSKAEIPKGKHEAKLEFPDR